MSTYDDTEELLRKLEHSTNPQVFQDIKKKAYPGTGQMKEHQHPMWGGDKKAKKKK